MNSLSQRKWYLKINIKSGIVGAGSRIKFEIADGYIFEWYSKNPLFVCKVGIMERSYLMKVDWRH